MPAIESLQTNYPTYSSPKEFIQHKAVVGWAEIHGSSKPITGLVIGRETTGMVTTDEGVYLEVETYVKVTGNEFPLLSIPNSRIQNGSTGKEVVIVENLTPEFAMVLSFTKHNQEAYPMEVNVEDLVAA